MPLCINSEIYFEYTIYCIHPTTTLQPTGTCRWSRLPSVVHRTPLNASGCDELAHATVPADPLTHTSSWWASCRECSCTAPCVGGTGTRPLSKAVEGGPRTPQRPRSRHT
ncbi:hypothetical protein H310_00761 [Aphanomyces invadans]|uniref:Uncharacterized protein n=1 Tax=Aphanomyces invadans TaxID=157072 RepID=A0A024UVC7_9STRA|nr:hypothetical protein H310_00761 [Aphanomyces invadans]ETW10461.1 hypothetical protein H310_00761 [Aphanomyces invadans]|eukprot:XP_008861872.1 hypothetical protein H310_00761 [Aphanomyces invadans]